MLGQLFQSWTPSRRGLPLSRGGSHSSQQQGLDSVTEDAHTLALLFPTPGGLQQGARDVPVPFHDVAPASASVFDELGPDAAVPQDSDVRILVAQDESGSLPKSVLFDSRPHQPPPPTPTSSSGDRPPSSFNFFPRSDVPSLQQSATLPSHARRGSHSQTSASSSFFRQSTDAPRSGPQPPRGHSRGRSNSSVGSLPSLRRLAKDADDEVLSCLECMFGSAALRYTGKSTKVHILSKDSSLSPPWDRATGNSSTFTLQAVARPSTSTRPSLPRLPLRLNSFSDDKTARKILITRVFSVPLPDFDPLSSPPEQRAADLGTAAAQSRLAPRQRRSPVYAVSLLIRIPTQPRHRRQPKSPTNSDLLNSWSSSLISDSARSSRGSDSMLESTIFDTNFGSLSSLADALEDEEGMAPVTKHWSVIGKVLDQLQRDVEQQVSALRDGAGYRLHRSGSLPMTLGSPRIAQDSAFNANSSSLHPFAFAGDDTMEAAAEMATKRLCQSFNTRHAVPGQDRWAVWREEARWVDRWARTSEQSTLLDNLLSAFLATHLEWLDKFGLGGGHHHRRASRHRRRKTHTEDETTARTVIVSNNKMKARRFVFLLAAFLPRSVELLSLPDSTPYGSERGDGFSSPTRIPTRASRTDLKSETAIESARRGSRELQRRYSSRQLSNLSAAIEVSRGGQGERRSRGSTSLVSGSPGRDGFRFTSSTTDISDTTPVAHITAPTMSPGASESAPKNRRGSSASSRLWDTLQYIPPPDVASPPLSPEATRVRKASLELHRSSGRSAGKAKEGQANESDCTNESTVTGPDESKLDRMVNELSNMGVAGSDASLEPTKSSLAAPDLPREQHGTAPRDIPTPRQKPSDPPMMPFSLSVNEKDGFVDVDIPLDSYGASLQSLSSRDQSDKGAATIAPLQMPPRRSSHDVSVGGYLASFCQDLALQAVRPYPALEDDLRGALASEAQTNPLPSTQPPPDPSWSEVSAILVANIDTGDLRKLSLRRRPAPADAPPEERVSLDRIPPDAADDALAAALARTLFAGDFASFQPSRASSLRTRSSNASAPGPESVAGSSGGTSVVGTPPGQSALAASDALRDRTRRTLFEPLRDIVRLASADLLDPDAAAPQAESMLRRAVRERLAAG